MATKIIPYNGLSSLLTLYIVLTRDDDGYILDSSDMTYKAPATVGIAPANALTEREIDGVKTQVYEFTDSTTVWNDGTYRFRIYEQAGGAAAINTDRIFASGTLIVRGDAIIERSYSFGGEIDNVPVDVENVVQTAANDIIAALGTVNTNLGTLEDDVEVMTATTPTIYNISIAVADTEYSQALPANTKRFALSIIDGTPGENFRWAYETGKVATPTAPYRQLDQSFEYECDKINSSATIYVAASDICVAQLEVWT